MFLNLITVAIFLAVFLAAFLIGDLVSRRRRLQHHRALVDAAVASPETDLAEPGTGRLIEAFAQVIPQSNREIEKIEYDLKRAGYYKATALVEYLGTRNLLIVGVLVGAGFCAVVADPSSAMPEMMLGVGLIAAALGYGLPRLVLHRQANKRVARLEKGLPDALDVLAMCITGGLPLYQALGRVSEELRYSHPDVAVEFAIIRRQAEADTMTGALKQFSQRIDAQDVNALASLVSQTERLGTNVSTAMCDYADSVRRGQRQRAEEMASRTSIKMLFPVILCLAPPVFILLCGPPALRLYYFVKSAHEEGGILNPETLSSPEPLNTQDTQELLGTSPSSSGGSQPAQESPFGASAQPNLSDDDE